MTAIEFEHVGKQYRLGLVSTGTLSHDIHRWWQTSVLGKEDPYLKIGDVNDRAAKADSEYVWALRDIDFKVEQGDVVGIIGKNGAGKSTLLKLLSKVTAPTVGTIRSRGRIASLLEVGTGFHGEMTGRENIYMNGAILGMTKAEIDRKLDEIVAFSGCEKYIDTPVKRYSSGMTVRLGFAVAAFLEPEILVVDEVLAVGDAEFQKKAVGKMQDVSRGEGRTVLFVSHNMASVRQLCHTGILLDKGSITMTGPMDEVIDRYIADSTVDPDSIGAVWHKDVLEDKPVQLIHAEIQNAAGEPTSSISCDEDFFVDLIYETREKMDGTYGYMAIERGMEILVSDSRDFGYNIFDSLPLGISHIRLHFPKRLLASGTYTIRLNLASMFAKQWTYDANPLCLKFEVNDNFSFRGNNRKGFFSTLIDWEIVKE
mgnify:CR=1 FL=1